jgi:hypothetical protein
VLSEKQQSSNGAAVWNSARSSLWAASYTRSVW